jgi:hypothetical protein
MRGVTITDSTKDGRFLAVDLIDILRLLGPSAENAEWRMGALEAAGGAAADELHQLADTGVRVPGRTLLQLATEGTQVIDGVFTGYRTGDNDPWVIIRAIDSSAFDVQTEDTEVLARMRERFRNVAELPSAG